MRNTTNRSKKPPERRRPEKNANMISQTKTSPHTTRSRSTRPQTARAFVSNSVAPTVIRGPITPKDAISHYSSMLTPYEKTEIFNYPEIYYIGKLSHKDSQKGAKPNFDSPTHHYKVVIGDHILYRYEIRSLLGKGAFGQVVRCYDYKMKKQVAVKIIINTPQMHKQGAREIEMLKHLVSPDFNNNIIQLLDSFTFRNHLCAVFEVLGQNLYDYSKSMRFRPIAMGVVKKITKQILVALDFSHSHNIVHCDLKPENIMLISGGPEHGVQLIDYGSGCYIGDPHFDYIQSRFYRAPEVIIGLPYGPPMDLWSLAAIIVELLTGKPIFPGANEAEQISRYVEVLGLPPLEMVKNGKQSMRYFTESGILKQSVGKKKISPKSVSLSKLTGLRNSSLLDFLSKCFVWDQNKRITARDALQHPWVALDN